MKLGLILILFSLFGSAILTFFLRNYAIQRHLIDFPVERSSHVVPTPRGGGLSIVIVFITSLFVLYISGWINLHFILAVGIGGIVVAITGFIDDHRHVPASRRIIIHFIAAGCAIYWLGGVSTLDLGFATVNVGLWGYIIALVCIVWLLNLYNFMDGIDGIAGVEAVFVAGSAALLSLFFGGEGANFALIDCLLLAAVLGFLCWNMPPAKIFMGDVGSGFLGFVLGVLAISSVNDSLITVWAWLILMGIFIVDSTWTVLRRFLRGEKWYEAHCSHAYQRAAHRLNSHSKIVLAVVLINCFWLFPWAVAASNWPRYGFLFAIIAFIPLICLAILLNAGGQYPLKCDNTTLRLTMSNKMCNTAQLGM